MFALFAHHYTENGLTKAVDSQVALFHRQRILIAAVTSHMRSAMPNNNRLSPQLKTYYEIRWDKLLDELHELSIRLDRPYPIKTRRERRERVWLESNARSDRVDVME